MENNNEAQEVNQETMSFYDMSEEERNAMILKFCQDKIGNEILPKYADREITPELIEEVRVDVSKFFDELMCDVKKNSDNLEKRVY